MTARYIVGDVLDVLRAMPAGSVDLVLSSPPFLALRSYLPADHPDKAKEIGAEPTPGAFIDTLLDVVGECRRVLAPHGSLCFEMGDTYAGSGGAGGDYNTNGLREGQPKFRAGYLRNDRPGRVPQDEPKAAEPGRRRFLSPGVDPRYAQRGEQSMGTGAGGDWPLDKSLCLIPELLRVALVYGFNPLTGRTTPRWRARNVVRWCRPNPPVGALGDKVRPATSDIIVACVDRNRYFDLDAVRTPASGYEGPNGAARATASGQKPKGCLDTTNVAGAPPLDHWWHDEETFDQDAWHIPTEPYKGSHYATWPTDLLVRPILAMCPIKVCTMCGAPSERLTERPGALNSGTLRSRQPGHERANLSTVVPDVATVVTTGWTDCGHGSYRKGVVLDPFGGSGTTAVVALGHGRDAILIDLDERNAELARERVGMWLEVEHHQKDQEVPA